MLRKGAKITVWEIEPHEKYTDIQLSTSLKKKGKWVTSFSGRARCMGNAHMTIRDLKPGKDCKLIVDDFAIETVVTKTGSGKNATKTYRYSFLIFSFDKKKKVNVEKNDFSSLAEIDQTFKDIDDGELPFK